LSVENIRAFNIIGHINALEQVAMTLGKTGVFQPDEVQNFYSDTRNFTHIPSSNTYAEPLSKLTNAMGNLNIKAEYVKVKNFDPDFEELDRYSEKVANDVASLIEDNKNEQNLLNECRRAIEEASHFTTLDYNIEEIQSMKYVKTVFGRIPKENLSKLDKYKKELIEFVPCSEENKYVWGFYMTPTAQFEKVEQIFSRLYFEKSFLTNIDDIPAKKLEKLKSEVSDYEEAVKGSEKAIEDYAKNNQEEILKYYTKLSEYSLYGSIKTYAMVRDDYFCVTGWVPEKQAKSVKAKLKKIESVDVSVTNASDEPNLSPPSKLKNFFLARPFQFYTEMYGVPKYNEIDPTKFVAITYVLLFGIMFADVGHGFCLAIAGLLMWYLKKMPIGKILIPCGVSGMLFGGLFGSVFGFENGMDWLYVGILGMESKPIEVMSSEMTNMIIYLAVGIGMVLLCIAMGLNIYTSIRQNNVGKAIFDTSGICGLVFYGLLCAGLVGMLVLGVNLFSIPYILAIVVAFILIFMREPLIDLVNGKEDWKPESWGDFVLQNVFESIEVLLSYVTNTLSFLRVGAFVLVHTGMMTVVFTLAETVGSAGYIPVLIFGNALVCVLEALLVAIQVLRLEFYEMFSRFYSGEGKAYEPIKLKLTRN
jgi:V/A-type H+-transporting ATPase subunit I